MEPTSPHAPARTSSARQWADLWCALAALHGGALVLAWTCIWLGWVLPGRAFPGLAWHAHEMACGFATAAAIGLLIPRAPAGLSRTALLALWIAARIALAGTALVPAWIAAALDGSFFWLLAAALERPRVQESQWTRPCAAWPWLLLALINLDFHASALGWRSGLQAEQIQLPMHVILIPILNITSEQLPRVTRQTLGLQRSASDPAQLATLAIASLASACILDWIGAHSGAEVEEQSAALRTLSAVLLLLRWRAWHGPAALGSARLAPLHAAFLCVPAGLLLEGLSEVAPALLPETSAVHAIGIGGIGGLLLGWMTQTRMQQPAAVGSTARRRSATAALAVLLSALSRIAAALVPAWGRVCVPLAAALWIAAFALALWPRTGSAERPRA